MKLAETRGGWIWTAAVAVSSLGFFLLSCGGSSKPPPTPECLRNSDCEKYQPAGLVCALNYCVRQCRDSSDCPYNEHCVVIGNAGSSDGGADAGAGSVADAGAGANLATACQAPEVTICHYNSDCTPLICAIDQVCRSQCQTDVDCPGNLPGEVSMDPQVCTVNTHVCVDPKLDKDYDPATKDFRSLDGGPYVPDGGKQDGGRGGSSGTGGGAGHGGASGTGGAGNKDAAVDQGPAPSCAAGLAGFHPSNLPAGFTVPAGLPTVVQGNNNTFDTDSLTFTGTLVSGDGGQPMATHVTLSDGRTAALLLFESYTLATNVTLAVTGEPPLIIAADGNITIDGTITAVQSGTDHWYCGGAPGPATNARGGICGLNACNGGGAAGESDATQMIGSGGGAFCGKGGNGSVPLVDGGTATTPPAGGTPYGVPEIVPLVGGASSGSATSTVGQANHGGGAVEIVAGGTLTITENGVINMSGGADTSAYAIGG
ncbi:MAG TPA: hypothetical protein VHO06_27685, partial [Polyangia bacterium]|nr:hypothetical protein [Polyangia bacterium]